MAAKRSHYFGSDVPNAESKICLRVISPMEEDREIYAFADEGPLVGDELRDTFLWGRTYRPVLELEWVGPPQ